MNNSDDEDDEAEIQPAEDGEDSGEEYEQPNADGHICYMKHCHSCNTTHHRDEKCYMQPICPRPPDDYFIVNF